MEGAWGVFVLLMNFTNRLEMKANNTSRLRAVLKVFIRKCLVFAARAEGEEQYHVPFE